MKEETPPIKKSKLRFLKIFNPLSSGLKGPSRLVRTILLLALIYFLAAIPICLYEYYRALPGLYDPRPTAAGHLADPKDQEQLKPGVIFTRAIITLGDQLLESWLVNDVIYPTVLMDNPQNFQLGQLEVIRDSVRVLRDKLSRQRTTDKIDPLVDRAFAEFNIKAESWIFPSAEGSYGAGVKSLRAFQRNLAEGKSHFYPRADNLIELLDQLTSRLGGANQRLGNAPRDWTVRLSQETAGDRYSEGEKVTRVHVPWNKIDDHFYYARGVAYALYTLMAAVDWEFREVLKLKRSTELMQNIIDELALANFEPLLVQNGGRDSIWANHSLTLMATLESVRQKMLDLKKILEQ